MAHAYPRRNRIADLIRQSLSNSLYQKSNDPRFKKITVTDVEVSDDLHHANIFVSCLDLAEMDNLLKTLSKAQGFFRHHLAQDLTLRFVPQLHFQRDSAIISGQKIDDLLKTLHNEARLGEDSEKKS